MKQEFLEKITNIELNQLESVIIDTLLATKARNIENVINFLKNKTDYFKAPASTIFHSSYEGGLAKHSFNVYKILLELTKTLYLDLTEEDCAIIGLLHDVCKVNYYDVEYRNAKNEKGEWVKVPYYKVNDKMPFGTHADKSIILLQQLGLQLTKKQLYCIRYHMGAYEGKEVFNSLHSAIALVNEILYTELADQLATHLEEKQRKK